MKEIAVIFDLDGTTANIEHRLHHVRDVPGKKIRKNWKAFFDGIKDDAPNRWCINLIEMYNNRACQVLYVSGRPEDYRTQTEEWLNRNVPPNYILMMRPKGDYRDDTIIKQKIYRDLIEPFYSVEVVVDDRPKVCRAWRELGLLVLQCNDTEF